MSFKEVLRMFQERLKGVPKEFQGYLKGDQRALQGSFKCVPRLSEGSVRYVTRKFRNKFQECLNKVVNFNFVDAWHSSQLPKQKLGLLIHVRDKVLNLNSNKLSKDFV